MGVYIKGMEMPTDGEAVVLVISNENGKMLAEVDEYCGAVYEAIPVPPHGDLIDRDALIKDGWLNLYKEVMRMGGYAIHELPLNNPSIHVIIPAEEGET